MPRGRYGTCPPRTRLHAGVLLPAPCCGQFVATNASILKCVTNVRNIIAEFAAGSTLRVQLALYTCFDRLITKVRTRLLAPLCLLLVARLHTRQ